MFFKVLCYTVYAVIPSVNIIKHLSPQHLVNSCVWLERRAKKELLKIKFVALKILTV